MSFRASFKSTKLSVAAGVSNVPGRFENRFHRILLDHPSSIGPHDPSALLLILIWSGFD